MTPIPVFPTIGDALKTCEGFEEVKIIHPAAKGPEAIRTLVDAYRYKTRTGAPRAVILDATGFSEGLLNAVVATQEEPPPYLRLLLVARDRSEIPERLIKTGVVP